MKTRSKAVQERLGLLHDRYKQDLFARVDRRKDPFDVPGAYELRSDIVTAFDDLSRAVRHVGVSDDGPWI